MIPGVYKHLSTTILLGPLGLSGSLSYLTQNENIGVKTICVSPASYNSEEVL